MSHPGGAQRVCDDFRRSLRPDRRSVLRAGILGATGLSLGQLLRHEARAADNGKSTARKPSVIIAS